MKRSNVLLVGCVMSGLQLFAGETIIPLQDVLLFQNGAELHHRVAMPIREGENTLVLQGISPAADFSTLQITLSSGNTLAGHAYTIRETKDEEIARQWKQLRTDSARLSSDYKIIEQSLVILEKGLQQNIATSTNGKNTSDGISSTIKYYQQHAKELRGQLYAKETALADCKEQMNELRRKEQEMQQTNSLRTGVLTLYINALKEGSAQIDVKYFSYAGWWTMQYDAHITKIGAPITLSGKAVIQQTTGIDWEDVEIRLSSVSPSKGMTAPEPTPIVIRRYQPQPRPMMIAYSKSAAINDMLSGSAISEESAVEEAAVPFAGKEYTIGRGYTIKGNGEKQSIPLDEMTLNNVQYECYTLPQKDQRVYLTAHIGDINKKALLPGNVSVIYNNTYYGDQYMATNRTDNDMVLTLGEEQNVLIKREKTEDYTTQKQTQKDAQRTFTYQITLQNNAAEERNIVLEEVYPTSANNQISVTLSDKTTPADTLDKEKGVLRYDITLRPQETKTVTIGYTIKYPKDWTINL
ncbi:MAG TPA: hypothetical protein DIW30_04670 [Bacteroidales bacterium]|nr:hypothetical protein [Bacteroidales bacterium]